MLHNLTERILNWNCARGIIATFRNDGDEFVLPFYACCCFFIAQNIYWIKIFSCLLYISCAVAFNSVFYVFIGFFAVSMLLNSEWKIFKPINVFSLFSLRHKRLSQEKRIETLKKKRKEHQQVLFNLFIFAYRRYNVRWDFAFHCLPKRDRIHCDGERNINHNVAIIKRVRMEVIITVASQLHVQGTIDNRVVVAADWCVECFSSPLCNSNLHQIMKRYKLRASASRFSLKDFLVVCVLGRRKELKYSSSLLQPRAPLSDKINLLTLH